MAYTKEEIRNALKRYEETQSVSETIKILGYPNRVTLYKWIKQHQESKGSFPDVVSKRKKPAIINTRQRPLHPPLSLKLDILKRCFEKGEEIKKVSQETGYLRTIIYTWYRKYKKQGAIGLMSKRKYKDLPREPLSEPVSVPKSDTPPSELEALREKIMDMQMEIDVLKGTIDILKKDMGVNNKALLTNKEKMLIVDAHRNKYPLNKLLLMLNLSRSSYYFSRKQMICTDKYHEIREIIGQIFKTNYCCYGYRRIKAKLARAGHFISEKVIRRLMKEEGLVVLQRIRKKFSSYQGEITTAVDNLLKGDFRSATPNEKWVKDISEFAIPAGKVYLSVIVDCFDGLVVSDRISEQPNALLANETLEEALRRNPDASGLILHSDRGAHYRWPGWIEKTQEYRLRRSMSREELLT